MVLHVETRYCSVIYFKPCYFQVSSLPEGHDLLYTVCKGDNQGVQLYRGGL